MRSGYIDAFDYGFSPEATGPENAAALQAAVDQGGTIQVGRPGTYSVATTVLIGSHTSLEFGNGVFIEKDATAEPFSHVLLNRGALARTWDEGIVIRGLHIIVNGVDVRNWLVHGLHGHLAFFYVRDLRVERFRCLDIGRLQYGMHVCTFEDVIVDDVMVRGDKDGVHFGRGKRFTVRNGVFATYDDAVALNAHDYATGNPEVGWIEDGVIENCYDLDDGKVPIGYFCRLISGGWVDWYEGMTVQQSDLVVCNGRVYRVHASPDGVIYTSSTPPSHTQGVQTLDGIPWVMTQEDVAYSAGVRNVVFRDIVLAKPRVGFSFHFDNDRYSRSYYPGAGVPPQERIMIDHATVSHHGSPPIVTVSAPIDSISLRNCFFGRSGVRFESNVALRDFGRTRVSFLGCDFTAVEGSELVTNTTEGRTVVVESDMGSYSSSVVAAVQTGTNSEAE